MAASGNFCTLNPLAALGGGTPDFGTLSDGNTTAALGDTAFGNIGVTSGKWYWEMVITSSSPTGQAVGWANEQVNSGAELGYNSPSSQTGAQIVYMYLDKNPPEIISDAPKAASSGTDVDLAQTIAQYDIVGLAADFDNDKWYMSIDGSFTDMRSGQNPADGSNPLCSKTGEGGLVTIARTAGYVWYPAVGNWAASARTFKVNFGQDSTFGGQSSLPGTNANAADENGYGDFYYTPPSGFLALCSANLSISDDIDPAQTDDNFPGKNFNAIKYTGNGSNNHAISGLGFKPDMVWIQRISGGTSYGNGILDSSRGAGLGMYPDRTDADTSFTSDFDSFDSDGFTLDAGSAMNINNSGSPFVAHCWRANGGTTSSNTDGSITSTVQANQAAGFSIVTYSGSNSTGTIGHGLSKKPDFIITKNRSSAASWTVTHKNMNGGSEPANNGRIYLDSNGAYGVGSNLYDFSSFTNSVYAVNGGDVNLNNSGDNYVAYVWHGVEGYSAFGSYFANGDADGPFVYTGFRPRMIFIKMTVSGDGWGVWDSARGTENTIDNILFYNATTAESSSSYYNVDFLSNGFKVRSSNAQVNSTSYDPYIWGAWGDVPFKYNNTF